ncbi:MAG: MFS transporter [Adlercreutzia equolifaciens]
MVVSAADTTSKAKAVSTAAAASPAIAPTSSAPAKPAGASTPHTDHALHGRALALVFFGLLLAMFISSLSETIASTALPTIVGDLNGVEIMQWVSTAYILSSTLVMPIYGKLGDLIGRKRLLMAALTLYAAGKVVAAGHEHGDAHQRPPVSGLGGGGLIILSQATLSDVVPPRKLGTYMGVIGAVFAVSNVLGPLMGGWFVQVTGWRWIFWFTVPVALLAVVVLGLTLPRDARALGKHPLDWPGMMAMTVAVTSLVLAMAWGGTLIPWGSLPFMGLVALAVAAAVVFVLLERRAAEPIIPMGLFRNRNFVLCSVTGLLLNISFMGALNYLPTYFQIVDDLSPEVAGLVCTATSVGILITSTATGWAASKTGRYKGMLVAMCVVSTVGLFLLSRMQVHEALWVPVLYLFVLGFGMGLGMQLLVLVVQNEFPHAMVGTATAANNFFRQIGASVGTALVGALFTMRLTADVAGKLTHVDNLSLATLTPQIVDALPRSAQSVIAVGY